MASKVEGNKLPLSHTTKNGRRRSARRLHKKKLIEKHGGCVYCGGTDKLTIDHITPLSKGGSNRLENIQIACHSCNLDKSDMEHDEYVRQREFRSRLVEYIKGKHMEVKYKRGRTK